MLTMAALALAACAGEVDDTTGSRFTQPPAGSPPVVPTPAGDVTIVGQEVGHAIIDLPEIANATTPPLVQFTGVTSIVKNENGTPADIDTQPYTDLLRDRILLITREKLRFIERTLPPLQVSSSKKKKKSSTTTPPVNSTNPDYEILAELRGHVDAKFYRIQVQFVNMQTRDVLFNQVYSIGKETPSADQTVVQPVNPKNDAVEPPSMVPVQDPMAPAPPPVAPAEPPPATTPPSGNAPSGTL